MTKTDTQPDNSAGPDINEFVLENGRIPMFGDAIPPWQYRGWLLYHVQICDGHPSLPGRWGHYLRTLEAGQLLNEPIPRIEFTDCPPPDGKRMLEKCLNLIERREYTWEGFNLFVEWLAWGLAVSRVRPRIEELTNEALYRAFNLEPLLLHPHDYLGEILSDRRSNGWNPFAFFPTPSSAVEMMVQMLLGGGGDEPADIGETEVRRKKILDPAVGTGRMLLHASNFSYCLYGCDIDPLVTMICRVNAAFYAPWMAFPLSEEILGISLPPPPPAPLPVPEEHEPKHGETHFRCDDRGQGLLFH